MAQSTARRFGSGRVPFRFVERKCRFEGGDRRLQITRGGQDLAKVHQRVPAHVQVVGALRQLGGRAALHRAFIDVAEAREGATAGARHQDLRREVVLGRCLLARHDEAFGIVGSYGLSVAPANLTAPDVQSRPDGELSRKVVSPGGRLIGEVGEGNRKDIRNAVEAARKAGVSHILLAGPEKAVAEADSKPDGYLTAKINAVEALSDLLTRLGA